MSLHQLNSKKILNGPVLLSKTILGHSNCFLLSLATNGKDIYRLIQVKKSGSFFSSFNAIGCNKHQNLEFGPLMKFLCFFVIAITLLKYPYRSPRNQ